MHTKADKFYNTFSFFYPLVDLFLKPQKRRLMKEVNRCPAGRLLEIGAGTGTHLHLYERHHVTAIDSSKGMLEKAKKQPNHTAELLHMNGEDLQFKDASFDYVVLSHIIAVAENPEQLLTEVHRVLRPGGKVFILNHFTPDNWLKHADRALNAASRLLHFKSVFYIDSIKAISNFTLAAEIKFGRLSYFKLLIYSRA